MSRNQSSYQKVTAVHQMQGDVNLQWANDSRNGSERKESFKGKSKGVVEWFENSGPGLGMAQLIECLLSTHQALGLIPSTAQSLVSQYKPGIRVLRKGKQEDQKFKVTSSSIVHSQPGLRETRPQNKQPLVQVLLPVL